ncbi:alpha-2-macroglobulin [Helicobacter sp. MIT 00-7814]|uniref:alpha-2-macroglobulin family protein n=1 Tax=unclassified Helicobacter TaxID=2593540 RepID=UPI000E1F44FA|nr:MULTISPECIES: MG2 domain-containing protein [unclassified Helicobacter]RDU54994.1 alpha-2-macroglobulin [Helicobacter sp. MIT 00-7814]RDU55975.1 alpha-2-macroglobulin [Helicobacter sp. MIT 99-10781]
MWGRGFELKWLIGAFLGALMLFFSACGDEEKIFRKTQGVIDTDSIVSIELKEPMWSGAVQRREISKSKEAFKLNGNAIENVAFAFRDSTTLNMYPTADGLHLEPSKDYTLEIDFKALEKELGDSLKSPIKNATLKFSTKPIEFEFEFEGLSILQNGDKNAISAVVLTSQKISLEKAKSLISLQDAQGKSVNFHFNIVGGDESRVFSRRFEIVSEEITPRVDEDLLYTITLDGAKIGAKDEKKKLDVRIPKISDITFLEAMSKESGDKTSIVLRFSQELAKMPNLKSYIQIQPNMNFNVSQAGNEITLTGNFNFQTPYKIHITKGLVSPNGAMLKEDISAEIAISALPPAISFSSSGVFLPNGANKKLAFKSRNVTEVKLTLHKVYANNLTQFLYEKNLIGQTQENSARVSECEGYDDDDDEYGCSYGVDLSRIGDKVLEKTFKIDTEKNQWIQNELDFSELGDLKGIFFVKLNIEKVDYDFPSDWSDWRKNDFLSRRGTISKHLIFSNTALLAQSVGSQFILTAMDISKNTPIAGMSIVAVDKKNQVIESQNTNANGDATFTKANAKNTLYFMANNASGMAVLKLGSSLVSVDGFDVEGVMSEGGMRAFIYTDRGVHRPGDSIYFDAIVRNLDKALDPTHPVFLTLKTPRGKVFLDKVRLESKGNGFFHYEIKTPKSADTGVWEALLKVGDFTFRKELSVEAVVPNRIAVNITTDSVLEMPSDELSFELKAKYLFGAPAKDLEYSVQANIKLLKFSPSNFKGYTFDTPSSLNYGRIRSTEGNLNAQGEAKDSINLESVEKLNSNLIANITARVDENNGRSVTARKSVDLVFYKSFVGAKFPEQRYVQADSKISMPVVVVANDGKSTLAGKNVSYTVYSNQYSWWWDYDSYSEYLRSFKSDRNTKILAQGSLKTKKEPVLFEYTPAQNGELYIEFVDEESGAMAGGALYVSGYGEPLNAQKVNSLKIRSDKEQYAIGQEAKVSFESTPNSKALVIITKENRVLKRFWVDTKGNNTSLTIPITSEMSPNVYVSVAFLQNYTNTPNDRSLRLYGVVPLKVEDKESRLTYEIDAPESILPNSEFEVKISTKEGLPSTYSLAVVDEGLLGLTNFQTPNPWKYFYSKIALGLKLYDTYDLIIAKSFGKVQKVLKVGGEGVMDSESRAARQKSDEKAERFKPVVLYQAPANTDEKGNARIKLKMPGYFGSVRVMVVGAKEKRYGSASKNIQVSAPVVVMPTIPRSLKVGDTFQMPIELFATKGAIDAKVSVSTTKGIVNFKQASQNASIKGEGDSQTLIFEGVVGQEVGVENIAISVDSKSYKSKEIVEIDIKAINPFISTSESHTLKAKGTLTLSAPKSFVKGTNSGLISISTDPLLNISHRVKWLIHYPYGCVEQTTSSVLPQLYLDRLGSFKIDKKEVVENINAGITRLSGFVTPSGGLAYWQGESMPSAWGSNYAGHFLVLAKKLGYYVPDSLYSGWVAYEKNLVRSDENANIKAYALYLLALAGEPEIAVMNSLNEKSLRNLNTTAQWQLAAAYKLAGFEENAKAIANTLSIKPDSDEQYRRYSFGSNLRDEAMILEAYKTIYGKPQETLFNSIKAHLESDEWLSTQTSGYALLSMVNSKDSAEPKEIEGVIELNGEKQKFSESARMLNFELDSGSAKIEAKDSPLYVIYAWEGIPTDSIIKPISKKMRIERRFLDENGNSIDISKIASAKSFWIRLDLIKDESALVENVALTQSLPSGWEIENTRLNDDNLPEFVSENADATRYVDIRDDKVMWFFDLERAKSVFVKINTVTPGIYTLPPAYAEAMYDNSYEAASESQKVEVTAK